ncbi:MAG: alpha/beta fold hydrolase [Deltaproteobacteria bacterium]|nr:alpha/beta fold hydrolase [Deltaproteobacteria bacterium]
MRLALAVLVALTTQAAAARPRWQELPLPPAMPSADDHGSVDVNGAQIYYARYGKGDPVILLHGGLGNSDHWANQVPVLSPKFQVIAIDSRGQGRSTRTKSKVTYETMADDVVAVMDKLAIPRASIVGWSDGGEIALKLAIKHPDRVAKLFVFGANYNSDGSKPRSGRPADTFIAYAAKCRADYTKLSKTPKEWDALVDWLLPVWRTPMGFTKDQLRSITAPTLVADGDHDEVIVLDQIQEMAKLIPNAQLAIFKDASHFALWQSPDDFNQTLLAFLEG